MDPFESGAGHSDGRPPKYTTRDSPTCTTPDGECAAADATPTFTDTLDGVKAGLPPMRTDVVGVSSGAPTLWLGVVVRPRVDGDGGPPAAACRAAPPGDMPSATARATSDAVGDWATVSTGGRTEAPLALVAAATADNEADDTLAASCAGGDATAAPWLSGRLLRGIAATAAAAAPPATGELLLAEVAEPTRMEGDGRLTPSTGEAAADGVAATTPTFTVGAGSAPTFTDTGGVTGAVTAGRSAAVGAGRAPTVTVGTGAGPMRIVGAVLTTGDGVLTPAPTAVTAMGVASESADGVGCCWCKPPADGGCCGLAVGAKTGRPSGR